MCGIAGILSGPSDDPGTLRSPLEKMVAALRHRGPDNEGIESIPGAPSEPFGKPAREDAFLMCLDGDPVAWVDSHGTWIEWRGAEAA